MAIVISGGNVDTEKGGQGQMFATPSGSSSIGNLDSELLTSNPVVAPSFDPLALLRSLGIQQPQANAGYEQLGMAMNTLAQAIQSQTMQGPRNDGGGSFQGPPLSAGFDPNWLMTQTNAGSANGAAIGGGGGGGGGGGSNIPVGGMAAGWDSMTAKDFGKMKGASKLTGKGGFGSWFKGLFGG